MKKFKLNILPIIGIMVAVATLAFTNKGSDLTLLNEEPLWYYTEMTSSEEGNPEKYVPAEGNEPCPGASVVRCLITAPLISDEEGDRPDLLNAIEVSHKF